MVLPFVVTVILNTNRREDTLAALASLDSGDYPNHKIIVLDNASSDGSVKAIRSAFPAIEVIQLQTNRGYTGNNNVGIEAALKRGADWVFVLNEDTVVARDCLSRLIEIAEMRPEVGILGPMVYHFDEPNVIQSAGGKIGSNWQAWHLGQNEVDHGQFDQPHEVDWISGCGILVRRKVIEQVGSLDESFFYYWEETEWCVRARKSGWKVFHVPKAKLWHKGVQRDYQPSASVTYYDTRNHLLLLAKHGAPVSAKGRAWWTTIRTLASWTIRPKWRDRREHRQAMLQGAIDFISRRWGKRKVKLNG